MNKDVTFESWDTLVKYVKQFAFAHGVSDAQANAMIIERYFTLNFKERQKVERRLHWKQHRNKGFRSLPQFLNQKQKRRQKKKRLGVIVNVYC